MKHKLIILIAVFISTSSFGQKAAIDLFCQKVDSSLVDENIMLHSVQHQTGFKEARYFDHYYIDTSKKSLIKCMYEFNFEGDGQYIEFYYQNSKIIKISAKHRFGERKLAGYFYFKSDNLIDHTGGEINGKIGFDIEHILKTGNSYMSNFPAIIKSLKSLTQLPSVANMRLAAMGGRQINSRFFLRCQQRDGVPSYAR
jgi:hypothetical protein